MAGVLQQVSVMQLPQSIRSPALRRRRVGAFVERREDGGEGVILSGKFFVNPGFFSSCSGDFRAGAPRRPARLHRTPGFDD